MDDALRVGEGDRLADAQEEPELLGKRREARGGHVEPLSPDELHRVEGTPVREAPDVVDRDDPGVLEARQDAGLEAQAGGEVSGRVGEVENFDRDAPCQLGVLRLPDAPHPSAADLPAEEKAGSREVRGAKRPGEAPHGLRLERPHGGSTPRRARASSRNSSSLPVISPRRPRTIRRSSRRASERPFVTSETETPKRSARAA